MWWHLTLLVLGTSWCSGLEFRLSEDVVPVHYDVLYTIDMDPATNFSLFGISKILITANKDTSAITLHSKELTISKEKVKLVGDKETIDIADFTTDPDLDFLTLKTSRPLTKGRNYVLTIPFEDNIEEGLDGVYVSTYSDPISKQKEHLVTTQFEAISARKAFPCFDEPMMKATFTITIGHPAEFTAISNMPLETTTSDNTLEPYWSWDEMNRKIKKPQSSFKWDRFSKSVPMSTYLVAFVVSRFGHVVSPPGLSNTLFRIWAKNDSVYQTEYASTTGPKVLTFYEEWFGVKFPLPKQDMVAIPDFAAGAMENWGLVTYRETALLYDKDQSSLLNKERVFEVVAHELAHQWFGNLVTMKWWSDLWLNEGFATYMVSLAMAAVEPNWKAVDPYNINHILSFMTLDSLESSHPVSVALEDPKRISEIFDEISYRKGSSLIRMMVHFLGEDVFRKAINQYLEKYSYLNAEQDDLWRELTEVSLKYGGLSRNVTVKEIMDTWTKQTGYPLLTVTRDYSDKTVTVSQKRYLSMGGASSTSSSWWVPLNVLCETDVRNKVTSGVQWLSDSEGTSSQHQFSHGAAEKEWLLFNNHMIAPFRVNYDSRNWQLLVSVLNSDRFTSVPELSRVQLLSDAYDLSWINLLPYTTTLQLTNYLKRETEYLPLTTGLSGLNKIDTVLKRSSDYGAFQKYVRKLITEAYLNSGGFDSKKSRGHDDLIAVKKQVLLTRWACSMKVPECEERALQLFQEWSETSTSEESNPIPVEVRGVVYCAGVRAGGAAAWRRVLAARDMARAPSARHVLLLSLACTHEPWILLQYLEWAISDRSIIRRQDAGAVLASVTRSPVGYYIARDFLYNRVHDIYQSFSGQGRRLGHIIKALLDQFTSQAELDQFLAWREKNSKYLDDAKLTVEQAIEQATVNINWIKKNQKEVVDKLREFSNCTEFEETLRSEFHRIINSATNVNLLLLYKLCIVISVVFVR